MKTTKSNKKFLRILKDFFKFIFMIALVKCYESFYEVHKCFYFIYGGGINVVYDFLQIHLN